MTTVVNLTRQRYDIYIGRGSPFGNMFRIGKHGDRQQVIARYRAYFFNRLSIDTAFKQQVLQLKGKKLGCYCKPLACHGDVIVDYLDGGES